MESIIPKKLKPGDHIRVIAPARSLQLISESNREIATKRLGELGLTVSFGTNVEELDDFLSSSVESRLADLHDAFADPSVDGILTVIGGFNSNQLLDRIDWELIRSNPKIFCGFSDITALGNAIYAKTGLVTYSGLHYSSFGQKLHFEYSLEYFKKCLMSEEPFAVEVSSEWSDDRWWEDQAARELIPNPGHAVINPGQAEGTIIGGNLCTLNLLHGTEYIPSLADSILFVEDDAESLSHAFDRDLQSLIHQPGFHGVKGLVIGRFQAASKMTDELLRRIISSKPALKNLPIIAGTDFGHTDPKITFPIGGRARLEANPEANRIEIVEH